MRYINTGPGSWRVGAQLCPCCSCSVSRVSLRPARWATGDPVSRARMVCAHRCRLRIAVCASLLIARRPRRPPCRLWPTFRPSPLVDHQHTRTAGMLPKAAAFSLTATRCASLRSGAVAFVRGGAFKVRHAVTRCSQRCYRITGPRACRRVHAYPLISLDAFEPPWPLIACACRWDAQRWRRSRISIDCCASWQRGAACSR